MEVEPLPGEKEWEDEAVLAASEHCVITIDPDDALPAPAPARLPALSNPLPAAFLDTRFEKWTHMLPDSDLEASSDSDHGGSIRRSRSCEILPREAPREAPRLRTRATSSPIPPESESSDNSEQLRRARVRALIEFKHNCNIYGDVSSWYTKISLIVFWIKLVLAMVGTIFTVVAPEGTSSRIVGPLVTSILGALVTANRHFQLDVKSSSYSDAYRELASAYETAGQDLGGCPDEDIDFVLQGCRQTLNEIRGRHAPIPGWAVRLSVNKLNDELV